MTLLPDFLIHGRPSCTPADADLMWSTDKTDQEQAKALCSTCPLRRPCAAYALDADEQWGTWGGLTATDRLRLRHGPGWWIDEEGRIRQPCGTGEALGAHRAYGETCTACEDAERAQVAAQRRVQLAVEHGRARGGSRRGYELHRLLGEEPCRSCVLADRAAAAGRATKARRAARTGAGPMALAS